MEALKTILICGILGKLPLALRQLKMAHFWLIVTDANGCNSDTVSIIFDNFPLTILENTSSKKFLGITDILGRATTQNKQKKTLFLSL